MGERSPFNSYPIRKVNGQAGPSVTLKAEDVGAAAAPTGAVARVTGAAGQTTVTMAEAVPTANAWTVLLTINGVVQDAGVDFTTDGTTALHLTFPLQAGDKVVARHVYAH
jgi:hypothetical protein